MYRHYIIEVLVVRDLIKKKENTVLLGIFLIDLSQEIKYVCFIRDDQLDL